MGKEMEAKKATGDEDGAYAMVERADKVEEMGGGC
jgi:hypothetical protein